jgi:hypothetical protein
MYDCGFPPEVEGETGGISSRGFSSTIPGMQASR